MRTVANLLKALQPISIRDTALEAMGDTSENYIELQREQMVAGISSLGGKIGKYKSNKYAQMKFALSSVAGFGNVDLKLTGAFQDAMRADIDNIGFQVYSLDPKAASLEQRYGTIVFTLADDRKNIYIGDLWPVFEYRMERLLNNK